MEYQNHMFTVHSCAGTRELIGNVEKFIQGNFYIEQFGGAADRDCSPPTESPRVAHQCTGPSRNACRIPDER